MKKILIITFMVLLLCGCTQEGEKPNEVPQQTPQVDIKTGEIPPFESEERENLPLPETVEISDSMDFLNSLIANYEVLHFTEFDDVIELNRMKLEKGDDGSIFISHKPGRNTTTTTNAYFKKPLNEYFDTLDNHYGVLVRFKTDRADKFMFNFDSKFGRIMLDFYKGQYPAIDVGGDFFGDAMLKDDGNDYIYESGEWAYAFMTITNFGQQICYIWPEDDPSDYNYRIACGECWEWSKENPIMFSFEVYESGKSVTISDMWLYSYKEAKR